ncbi:MAG: galactose mutarotase [Lachnospiraceae bacterium]|nr:galactose mutarotase [Lachnospiraceae bacterium]
MGITTKSFGTTAKGEEAKLYILENKNGMKAVFSDFGAVLVQLWVPDRDGMLGDVVLGFDTLREYEKNPTFFGSFIGRCGNRIGGAKFTINGKVYWLEDNDNGNCLHSGSVSYDKHMYEADTFTMSDACGVQFSRLSPDKEQGFPGNLEVEVTYMLTDENELIINYLGVSDQDTIVNFTNHSYFNLEGHDSGWIYDQEVRIDADAFTITDENLIPTGELTDVTGTPMDFRVRKALGDGIDANYGPIRLAGGYDHNYALNNTGRNAAFAAELYDEQSGRLMEVYTDLPGMQLYSGNFIRNGLRGKGGCTYGKRAGVCFETQFFPNAINIESFKSPIAKAGRPARSITIYKFKVE